MSDDNAVDLEKMLEEDILVYLKGGIRLEGSLAKYDDYMNLVLKNAEEYEEDDLIQKHKLVIVKGGNIRGISSQTDSMS